MSDESPVMCELCGAESEMKFNILIPISEEEAAFITGDVCPSCFGSYPDDVALAMAIVEKRIVAAMENAKKLRRDMDGLE